MMNAMNPDRFSAAFLYALRQLRAAASLPAIPVDERHRVELIESFSFGLDLADICVENATYDA